MIMNLTIRLISYVGWMCWLTRHYTIDIDIYEHDHNKVMSLRHHQYIHLMDMIEIKCPANYFNSFIRREKGTLNLNWSAPRAKVIFQLFMVSGGNSDKQFVKWETATQSMRSGSHRNVREVVQLNYGAIIKTVPSFLSFFLQLFECRRKHGNKKWERQLPIAILIGFILCYQMNPFRNPTWRVNDRWTGRWWRVNNNFQF